ncbi:hypothetical protein [Streptomyces sp. NPDC001404]|uniref:hypothetical protein n=1 Tax=Streptomyces sp. NPDC001404 TaxID=3364571 RepID=UPI0036BF7F8E
MGFLSRYTGTDIIDLGESYSVTVLQHLPGDAQEAAEAAKVRAVANVRTSDDGGAQRTVEVATSTDTATYTTLLLAAAIVSWNLTDERDQLLPLEPEDARLASIRRLPAEVRTTLRNRIEANIAAEQRSPAEQQTFRVPSDGGHPVGEGWSGHPAGTETAGSLLDTAGHFGS